jgi:hypothetical protein
MSQLCGMATFFNTVSLDNNVREVLTHLFSEQVLNPSNPIAASYSPYFQFQWGERVQKCEYGRPKVWAYPAGATQTRDGLNENRLDYLFALGLVAGGDDRKSEDLFYEGYSRARAVFGLAGSWYKFTNDYTSTTIHSDASRTIAAPFRLVDLGVKDSRIFSSGSPRRLEGDHCKSLFVEMLVRWRFEIVAGLKC